MHNYVDQEIHNFTKLDHVHHCAIALESHDIQNFVRHFLYLINNWQNAPETEETIRATIVRLTGWKPQSITNAIAHLIRIGELVRVNEHRVMLNTKVGNKGRSTRVYSEYNGNPLRYSERQQELIDELRQLIRKHTSNLPSLADFEAETERLQREEQQEMANAVLQEQLRVVYQKLDEKDHEVQRVHEKLDSMSRMFSERFAELFMELRKYDPERAAQLEKRHLHLVKSE